ncbi:hypothetical protein HK405_014622, partial [Cladochytrium tenue]
GHVGIFLHGRGFFVEVDRHVDNCRRCQVQHLHKVFSGEYIYDSVVHLQNLQDQHVDVGDDRGGRREVDNLYHKNNKDVDNILGHNSNDGRCRRGSRLHCHNTALGSVSIYGPLLINKGQSHVTPVVPTLTSTSVVGCWFGTNGASTTLVDSNNGNDLTTANCVNGAGGTIFGQFAACNGAEFFTAANSAGLEIPTLATGSNGNTCYTTRSFELVDMDQSDNVLTTYLVDGNGKIAQNNAANQAAMSGATVISNGSDNVLKDDFLGVALGCSPWKSTNLADSGNTVGSLALNELQAAKYQASPIALVPPNDPMVVDGNGNMLLAKQTAYRSAVNQAAGAGTTAEATEYCTNYLNVGAPSIITDSAFTIGFSTPGAANGVDLYTFLGNRFQLSWEGLGCADLVSVTYLNTTATQPILSVLDANGVTVSLTFNTATLLKLAQSSGLVSSSSTTTTAKAATATTSTSTKAAAAATTTSAAAGGSVVTSTIIVTATRTV